MNNCATMASIRHNEQENNQTVKMHNLLHVVLSEYQGDLSNKSWYYWPEDTEEFRKHLEHNPIKGMPESVRTNILKGTNDKSS